MSWEEAKSLLLRELDALNRTIVRLDAAIERSETARAASDRAYQARIDALEEQLATYKLASERRIGRLEAKVAAIALVAGSAPIALYKIVEVFK